MADAGSSAITDRAKRPWVVGAVAVVVFLAVGVLVVLTIPRGSSPAQRSTFTVASPSTDHGRKESGVGVLLTIDSLEDTAGGVQARLMAVPGSALAAPGATLFSSLGSAPVQVVRPNQIGQERTVSLPFASGQVADYPFDSYRVPVHLIALVGTGTGLAGVTSRKVLPLEIEGTNNAAGTVVVATSRTDRDGVLIVSLSIRRSLASRGWVLAMMAIYWALAILAAAITYLVLRGRRPFETRMLAWLSALVFALIAFRMAAPGAPPVGTFLDYAAIFESVGIVAASLIALMIFYAMSSQRLPG